MRCEVRNRNDLLAQAITNTLREVCKLRGQVEFADAGSLPNDGKVIEDLRKYDLVTLSAKARRRKDRKKAKRSKNV